MKIQENLRQFTKKHSNITIVIFLAILAMIVYIPRIWQLGFYNEDWYVLWGGKLSGYLKIIDMHLVDRPFFGLHSAILYIIFGDNPLPYHIYILLLRILSSIFLYFVFCKCFTNSKSTGLFASIIFLIYPGFLVQPVAVTHANYLLAFLFAMISLLINASTIENINKKKQILFFILSGCFAVLSYLLMEWFITFELVRLIILYRQNKNFLVNQKFLSRVLYLQKKYLPVAIFVLIFLIFRLFIFKSGRSTTDIGETVRSIISTPFDFTVYFLLRIFENFSTEIILAWFIPIQRLVNFSTNRDLLIAFLIGSLTIAFIYFSLSVISHPKNNDENKKSTEKKNIWLSLILIIIAIIPLSIINRRIGFDSLYSKYTLPGLFGVCLLIGTLLNVIQSSTIQKIALLVLVLIGVTTNQLNSVYYHNYSEIQNRLWWQLSWRTPNIKEGTTVFPLLPEGFRFSDNWEIWSQADLTYGSTQNPLYITGEVINSETIKDILSNYSYGRNFRKIHINIDMNNALVVSLDSPKACLHVIDNENYETMVEDDNLITLISEKSKIDLLDINSTNQMVPDSVIFGPEPEHDWCYYYQKASLYRQQQKWQDLNNLADEAIKAGITPQHVDEWLPMYEGYVQTKRTESANYLSNIIKSDEKFVIHYCPSKVSLLDNVNETQRIVITDICSWYMEKNE